MGGGTGTPEAGPRSRKSLSLKNLRLLKTFNFLCFLLKIGLADIYYIRVNHNKGEDMIYLLTAACILGIIGADVFNKFVIKNLE